MRSALLAAILLLLAAPLPAVKAESHGAAAGQPVTVTVHVASGRSFTGLVDERTDKEHLWLRYGRAAITILRPIQWDRIVSAVHQGQQMDTAQLRRLAPTLRTSTARGRPYYRHNPPSPSDRPPATWPSTTERTAAGPRRVARVQFDAELANWDGDVADDGLILWLRPLSADGALVPVDGRVMIELTAARRRPPHQRPHGRGFAVVTVARWSKVLKRREARPEGFVVQLPFQAIHPERDSALASSGLLHVRLVVPGQGVFEASRDAVRMRAFAPLRDQRQHNGQSRFLATEDAGPR